MSLFERGHFETHVMGLPHVELVHQWGGASVGKVGDTKTRKIFAILSHWSSEVPAISFKCSDMSFAMLPQLEGARPAPYLARAKWIQVMQGSALSDDEIAAYIANAHRLVSQTLPKRGRLALGMY